MAKAAILDVDGTLVDTNYQHALAWFRAFRQHGFVVPIWTIHRAIGMGGDQLVPHLIGEEKAEEVGDDLRAAEKPLFRAMIDECEPLEGARDLISDLRGRDKTVILASSANEQDIGHYLDLLDAHELADDWTTSDDVERTKPEPDLVKAAIEKAGTDDAVMVGDTTWDIEAARRAGIATIAVMTGGFSADELREAGAAQVFESIEELRQRIGETALG
ncbi:MAG TPA: HAD family hydrolase [Solirubrobacteraceae bacterium]|nr:HAD family hydrolase [Solirubrobacteraceae bacterium]